MGTTYISRRKFSHQCASPSRWTQPVLSGLLQVTLRLLELSQISMPVAMLRNNANLEVATLAKTLAKRWRELAVAALDCATKALERRA